VISGTPQQSAQMQMSGSAWAATSDTTYGYAWERCNAAGSACQSIAGANSSAYTPTAGDVGGTLVAVSTAANADGTLSASSAPSAIVLPAVPRWLALPVLATDPGDVGDVLTVTQGTWRGPVVASDVLQWMRCTSSCVPVGSPGDISYTLASGDVGAIVRVVETASNAGGNAVVWSARYVGPILSAASGSAVLSSGSAAVRNSQGVTLATATLPTPASHAASIHPGAAATPAQIVKVTRAAGVSGKLRAWACPAPTASKTGAAPPKCSVAVTVKGSVQLKVPGAAAGKLVVVVRRGH
jgi:hypothetical protein